MKRIKRRISILMAMMILVAALPLSGVFAAGEEGSGTEGGNKPEVISAEDSLNTVGDIFALDFITPAGMSTAESAYGEGIEQPFTILEKNDLYFYQSHIGGYNTWLLDKLDNTYQSIEGEGENVWLRGISFSSVRSVRDLFNTSYAQGTGTNNNPITKLNYVSGVAFDPTGSGRNDHVALIGYQYEESGNHVVKVYVQSAVTGRTWAVELGAVSWMADQYLWYMSNFLSITAGDYDGDGRDSVIAYFCGDKEAKLFEVRLDNGTLSRRETADLSVSLDSHDYREWYNNDSTKNLNYTKPVVSLATGDLNGDGVDQLAYMVGFHNTSRSVADGYQNYDCSSLDYFAADLFITEYRSGSIVTVSNMELYDVGDITSSQNGREERKITMIHGGAVIAGDTDGDGIDEIIAAGYTDVDQARAIFQKEGSDSTLVRVHNICNWNAENFAYTVVKGQENGYVRTTVGTTPLSAFTGAGFYHEDDRVHAQFAMACAKTNGASMPVDVFINGYIYSFEKGIPQPLYQSSWFSNTRSDKYLTGAGSKLGKNSCTNQWVASVTAGNFDKNDAGREQFVFVLMFKEKSAYNYSANIFSMGGTSYGDTYVNGELATLAKEPAYYATNANEGMAALNSHPFVYDGEVNGSDDSKWASQLCIRNGSSLTSPMNFVPLAVCVNDESLVGRERGFYYLYTDPRVEAVLEAAPYFGELNELGGHDEGETTYTIETSYGTSREDSREITVGVSVSGEVQFAGSLKISGSIGYSHGFSKSTENAYTTTYSTSFAGADQDVVVISRIPVLINSYDILTQSATYNPDGTVKTPEVWKSSAYNVNVPQAPVYFLLSVDDYNDFVDEYNTKLGTDLVDPATGQVVYDASAVNAVQLVKIKTSGSHPDLPEDHIGKPQNYWPEWSVLNGAGTGAMNLSAGNYASVPSVTSSMTSEWSHEAEQSVSSGHSNTLSASLTVEVGHSCSIMGIAESGWAVGLTNEFESVWSHVSSTTTAKAKGSSGTVSNINKAALTSQGISASTVDSYSFNWTFGKWERKLTSAADDPNVLFFGYAVTNVHAAIAPPENAVADKEDDGIAVSWEPPSEVNGTIAGYRVYLVEEDGTPTLIGSVGAGETGFVYTSSDRLDYRFVIRTVDNRGVESVNSNTARYVEAAGAGIADISYTGTEGNVDTYTITLTNGETYTFTVTNGVGIANVELTSSSGLTDTYTITFSDGNTTTFTIHNGKDGADGKDGEDGTGIVSIGLTSSEGNADTYTITLSDGSTYELVITNGADGKDGKSAYQIAVERGFKGTVAEWIASLSGNGIGIERIEKTGTEGNIDTYTIYYTDGSTQTFTVENGQDGKDGADGEDGRGIVGFEMTGSKDGVDTYVVTYTDGTTTEFTVTNGKDGADGQDGTDGLSAYEIAVLYGFEGTPAEWVASLIGDRGISILKIEKTAENGGEDGLTDTYTIFLSDGTAYSFTVNNGARGEQGEQGEQGVGIVSIDYASTSGDGLTDTYTITMSDGSTGSFSVRNGASGVGVDRVEHTGYAADSEDGLTDTYTIYLTNGDTCTYTIANGSDGEDGKDGEDGEDGRGIFSVEKTGSEGNLDIYTVTYTDGTTSEFRLANGADGAAGKSAYEIAVENGYTGTAAEWVMSLIGDDGIGLAKIEKTSSDGLVDTYTIWYTDSTSYTFTVTNGAQGEQGLQGEQGVGIVSIEYASTSEDGLTDSYLISMSDGNTASFTVRNGAKGEKGDKGDDGVGVASVEHTGFAADSEDGLTDTYTIVLTNGESFSYTVVNGQAGQDGKDGKDGAAGNGIESIEKVDHEEGDDPYTDTYLIKFTNGDMAGFTVRNGKDGADGKTAYELAVENGYTGTVLEWLASLKGDGISLLGIDREQTDELTMRYTFRYSDGTTFSFDVKNGEKGDKGDAGEKGDQGAPGEKGDQGDAGRDGRGIVTIVKTSSEGLTDTYTVTYTDGTTSALTVTNGAKGEKGDSGANGRNGTNGTNGRDGTAGRNGTNGVNGRDGVSISGLELTRRNGEEDTYTIRYTNGTDSQIVIRNGTNGADGRDGKDGDPGVGIANVQISRTGDQIVTLTDGSTINAGSVLVRNEGDRQTLTRTGGIRNYYFPVSAEEVTAVTVDGKEVKEGDYTITRMGDGVLISINEDLLPDSGGIIEVVTSAGSETTAVKQAAAAVRYPWWMLAVLGVLSLAVIAEGVQLIQLQHKAKKEEKE